MLSSNKATDEMYNEHTTFLGEGRFFNILHGKVSSFLSANKENQQKMKIPYTELTLIRISHCHFHANTLMKQRKGGANKKSTSDKWMSDVPS